MAESNNSAEWEDDLYDGDEEDTMNNRFLTFCVGDEGYGIEIRYVMEIIGVQKITEVPDMPNYVKGVINLRGKVIPVIDVRARFMIEDRDYDDRTCIVVVNISDSTVGLIVDRVAEVQDIPADNISPPPSTQQGAGSRFILGMGRVEEEVKILLDVPKLLFEEGVESLQMVEEAQ